MIPSRTGKRSQDPFKENLTPFNRSGIDALTDHESQQSFADPIVSDLKGRLDHALELVNRKHQRLRVEVTLPVLNEEKVLAKSVKALRDHLHVELHDFDCGIVIVDNGSTDSTLEICAQLNDQYEDVSYISLPQRGRGRALRFHWTNSTADICCYMDVDLSTDLSALRPLLESLRSDGFDIATGCRLMAGSEIKRSIKREILSRGYVFLLRFYLGVKIRDAQCGFKAVNRRVIDDLLPMVLDQEWFFDSELLFKAHRWGYKVKELPVCWIEDKDSRVRLYKTVKNYLLSLLRIKLEFAIESVQPK